MQTVSEYVSEQVKKMMNKPIDEPERVSCYGRVDD